MSTSMAKMPPGFGFDPDVCDGCPHHKFYTKGNDDNGIIEKIANRIAGDKDGYWGCSLCGCPTQEGMLLDRTGMPPKKCPRLDQHKGK